MITKVLKLIPCQRQSKYFSTLISSLTTPLIEEGKAKEQKICYGRPFPLIIQPRNTRVNFIQLQEYFLEKKDMIQQAITDHGGILFRNFDIKSGEEWASILYKSGLKEQLYEGHAVRKLIVGKDQTDSTEINRMQVMTANEAPPNMPITFHHELAYSPSPCSHISVFCCQPSVKGGATPIIRSDYMWDWIVQEYPELASKFEDGVQYVKRIPEVSDPLSNIGKSWKETFNVRTREEAVEVLKKSYDTWEWIQIEDGTYDLKFSTKIIPAAKIGSNGKKAFFNQIYGAVTGWIVDKRNRDHKTVVFRDGSHLPDGFIDKLTQFSEENKVAYLWQSGDFIMLDNTIAQHGRETFEGRRRVFASISRGFKGVESKECGIVMSNGEILPAIGVEFKMKDDSVSKQVTLNLKQNKIKFVNSSPINQNERQIGKGLLNAINNEQMQRKDLFISSKLWNTYHRKENVKNACKRSLKDLGLDYLDLYSVQYPYAFEFIPFEKKYPPELMDSIYPQILLDDVPFQETWQAMEELVKEGLVLNIGIDSIGVQLLRDVLTYAQIKPSVVQIEIHPYLSQENLVNFCRTNGIAVISNNLFGDSQILNDHTIIEIAKETGKTPQQVCIRWAYQNGVGVILNQNDILNYSNDAAFNLSDKQMQRIDSLNKNQRFEKLANDLKKLFPIYDY